jgi:uncharacterized membrane protein
MSNKFTYTSFILIFIFAAILRFYHLGNFGIFGDEKQGILIAVGNVNIGGQRASMSPDKTFTPKDFWRTKTIKELFDASARGDTSGNATVHLLFMNIFGKLFGHSDFSLRSVSVLFNLLTLLLVFLIGKTLFKSNIVALIASLLFAIEPFFIIFSQQARFYTTCIFFSTLASYIFLKIISSEKNSFKTYLAYTLSIILCIFSNYLTFTILIGHSIYWLLVDRNLTKLRNLTFCYVAMAIPFILWMTKGPGQYALLYIKDASNFYKSILNNPTIAASYKGFIDFASWDKLFKKSVNILSDYSILTNDFYTLFGNKISVVAVILTIILIFYLGFRKSNATENKLLIFSGLIVILPFIFSLISTYFAGVMTGFYFRYTSFGLPFVSIVMAWLLVKSFQYFKPLGIALGLLMLFQIYNFAIILNNFYQDLPQKYSSSFSRGYNPYILIADKIKSNYVKGDTLFYPSLYENVFSKVSKRETEAFDNNDAQLINLYLPKDALFVQRIDKNESNKVVLQKSNNQRIVLFDFEGSKYRY